MTSRELFLPLPEEQMKAVEHALCAGLLHPDARRVALGRMTDWLQLALGDRRRAHAYRREALNYEAEGNLHQYRECRKQSDRSWRLAKQALADAKLQRRLAS